MASAGADSNKFLSISGDLEASAAKIMKEVIGEQPYDPQKATEWLKEITSRILSFTTDHFQDYRFVVNTILSQKSGGLHTTSACYWDAATDGSRIARYENEQMHCIAVIYALTVN